MPTTTSKTFTFSIKAVLALTVSVAVWFGLFQALPNLAIQLLCPYAYGVAVTLSKQFHAFLWFPVFSLTTGFLTEFATQADMESLVFFCILGLTTSIAIAEYAVRTTRERFASDNVPIVFYDLVMLKSLLAGAIVGLSLGLCFTFIGIVVSVSMGHSVAGAGLIGIVSIGVIVLACTLWATIISIPAAFIAEFFVRRDIRREHPELTN